MICTRCGEIVDDKTQICRCGFRFAGLEGEDLQRWFDEVRQILETAYLQKENPWNQSGKSGSFEEWTRVRIPISECIEKSGTFLDIGCANGFLLECLLDWTGKKGAAIIPYGLDFSEKLVELAKRRLPDFRDNIFLGNGWNWEPPLKFDYVRTELCYVPQDLQKDFVSRLLDKFLVDDGKLLVAHYRSHREDLTKDWVDGYLIDMGFKVNGYSRGFNKDGLETTRIAVVQR